MTEIYVSTAKMTSATEHPGGSPAWAQTPPVAQEPVTLSAAPPTTNGSVRVPDGSVIPASHRGRGSVAAVHKVEMVGKAGELNVRLDDLRIGDTRVHLSGNQGGEGKSMQSTAIALSLLVTPLFLLRHGVPEGTTHHRLCR
jgi:hypothetical protein